MHAQPAGGVESTVTFQASEVLGFLVIDQVVRIFKVLIAVIADRAIEQVLQARHVLAFVLPHPDDASCSLQPSGQEESAEDNGRYGFGDEGW